MNGDMLKELQDMTDHDLLIRISERVEDIKYIPKMRIRLRVLEVLVGLMLAGGGLAGILEGFVF